MALQTYFGYDPYTTICNRKDYQTEQWETIIYNELKAGRPVFWRGYHHHLLHIIESAGLRSGSYLTRFERRKSEKTVMANRSR